MALFGIYGSHTPENCPLNDKTIGEGVLKSAGGLESVAAKHGIKRIINQYHSSLEHTFLWVVEAEDAHRIEQFCLESGLAKFNTLKIVPLITFEEGVVPQIKEIHGL